MKKGFTLIELGISMGIMGSMALVGIQEDKFESSQLKARAMGNEIFQHNAAVSRYIAANAGDSSVVGTRVGSDWLKSTDCFAGTATEDFLSCDLLPNNRTVQFGSQPRTTISYSVDGDMSARTVWDTVLGEQGNPDGLIMGTTALMASGSYISQYDEAASGYQSPTVYCPDLAAISATISSICGTERNVIISTANITSTVEPWLRTDHNNTMRHVIEFDPDGNRTTEAELKLEENRGDRSWLRQMIGVARLYNGIDPGGQSLALGARSGNGIYSDSFLTGKGLLNGAIIMDGDIGVMNDIYGKANAFIGGSLTADVDLIAKNNVIADFDVIAKRDAYAQRYYDSNDDRFFVDSASTSRMNDVDANLLRSRGEVHGTLFRDYNDGAYYVDPNATSKVNTVHASGTMTANRYYDDDNRFYAEMNGRSHFNALTLHNGGADALVVGGRIKTNEFLHLNRSVSEGNSCSPNGLISMTGSGTMVSCFSGRWAIAGQAGSACTRNTSYSTTTTISSLTKRHRTYTCPHDQSGWVLTADATVTRTAPYVPPPPPKKEFNGDSDGTGGGGMR